MSNIKQSVDKVVKVLDEIEKAKEQSLTLIDMYQQHVGNNTVAIVARDIIIWCNFICGVTIIIVIVICSRKSKEHQVQASTSEEHDIPEHCEQSPDVVDFAVNAPSHTVFQETATKRHCFCLNKCLTNRCPCKSNGLECNEMCHPDSETCCNKA